MESASYCSTRVGTSTGGTGSRTHNPTPLSIHLQIIFVLFVQLLQLLCKFNPRLTHAMQRLLILLMMLCYHTRNKEFTHKVGQRGSLQYKMLYPERKGHVNT